MSEAKFTICNDSKL